MEFEPLSEWLARRSSNESNAHKTWTKFELSMLGLFYPESSKETVLDAIPGRSWEQIKGKASALKIKRLVGVSATQVTWTVEEQVIMKKFYPTEPLWKMEMLLPGRTRAQMAAFASRNDCRRSSDSFTPEQLNIVANIHKLSRDAIMAALPNHTWRQITVAARNRFDIKLGYLTDHDKEIFWSMYMDPYTSQAMIQDYLGITTATARKAYNLIMPRKIASGETSMHRLTRVKKLRHLLGLQRTEVCAAARRTLGVQC